MSSQYFQKDSYVTLVKTIDSYGIDIVNSYSDFDLIGKKFNSNPLVYFYDSFNKVIFDYTNTESQEDLDLLNILLQGLTVGNTFEVKDGYYVKEQDGITSNINGIYQFDSSSLGSTDLEKIIFATKITATDLNTNEYRYERDYFVNNIQIDLNRGFTGDTSNIIKCVLHEGVINNLGLYPGDLIEINYPGITQNNDRFEIEKVETSEDGEEFIFVNSTLISENRIGKITTLNVYNRGDLPIEYLSLNKSLNGAARVYDSNGLYLSCFDNQNEIQAYLRRYNTSDPKSIVFWGYSSNCNGIAVDTIENTSQGQIYDVLIDVKVETTSTGKQYLINGNSRPVIELVSGTNYLFYQGNSSNYSSTTPFQLVFTKKKGSVKEEDLLKDFYTITGSPGNSNSCIKLQASKTLPSIFYYECLNVPNMGGTILITGLSVGESLASNNYIEIGQYVANNSTTLAPVIKPT
jgi:hypothetical protein